MGLASNAVDIPDHVLEMAYSNGLRSKLRAGIKMFDPRNLDQMMHMAKKVEKWHGEEDTSVNRTSKPNNGAQKNPSKTGNNTQIQAQTQTRPKTQTNPNVATPKGNGIRGQNSHSHLKPPFRRLTPVEVERWKAEGLCFKCDEKFHPNHQCAQAQVTVLVLHANGVEEELLDEPCELEEE